jgi:hypothetical protein
MNEETKKQIEQLINQRKEWLLILLIAILVISCKPTVITFINDKPPIGIYKPLSYEELGYKLPYDSLPKELKTYLDSVKCDTSTKQ